MEKFTGLKLLLGDLNAEPDATAMRQVRLFFFSSTSMFHVIASPRERISDWWRLLLLVPLYWNDGVGVGQF